MTKKVQFSLKQLLLVACLKEQESIELYTALLNKTSDSSLRKIFKALLKDERKHKHFYSEMIKQLNLNDDMILDKENEYAVYMINLMEEHKASYEVTANQIESVSQALNYAILREKHSILFFTGLQYYVPIEFRSTLDSIIRQEMQHAEKLIILRDKTHN